MGKTKTIQITIKGCDECEKYYKYASNGSFCHHPEVKKQMKGQPGLISNGFVSGKFPDWCPL